MSNNSLKKLKEDAAPNAALPTGSKVEVVKLGRKPKPESEKANKPITLKFTQAEFDKISKKAGMINKATLLKKLLLDETNLLK
jgi:hypothetical protein